MKKYLKQVLLLLLLALCIISLKENKTYAMTTEDLEQYAIQGKIAYDSTHGTSATDNFDQYVNLINSNLWASYKSTMNISNYDSVLFRAYYGSSSPYLTYVSLNFFVNTNKNLQIVSTGNQDSTGQSTGYIRAVNNNEITIHRWTFKTTQRNGTEWQLDSNDSFTFSNSSSAYKTNESLLFYTGNIINQHNILYYGYNILNKIEASSIFNFNGLTKVADIRIGEFYNAYNVTYKLYALSQNNKEYKGIEYRQLLDSGETLQGRTGELELINIFNKTNSDFCYIEMLDENNNIICTSNRFTITMSDSGGPSSYAPTYNSSGEQTGTIDISGIINSVENQTYMIYSGDQQIINKIEEQESGEKARFKFWQGVYDGLFTLSSGDVYSLKNKLGNILDLENNSEYAEELNFFEELEDVQPGDFIIEWPSFRFQNVELIQTGSINFSLYTRNNTILGRVHNIFQTIVTGLISILILKELWRITCILLGIGTEIYDNGDQENEIIENTSYETYGTYNDYITRRVYTRRDKNGNKTRLTGKPINITRG